MKTTKLFILTILISINPVFAQESSVSDNPQTVEKSYLELPRIQVIPIKDTKAGRQYELYIKLPEEYSENNDIQYPVLYWSQSLVKTMHF